MTTSEQIKTFYKNNKIDIEIIDNIKGLQVTTYKTIIKDLNDKTLNKINKLLPALCLYLKKDKINIRQDNKVGALLFEIPNDKRQFLNFNNLEKVKDTHGGLLVNLGIDTQNKNIIFDLCDAPHLLIAGTTGSGKSVLVNNILTQLFYNYTPNELEAILIDIKKVEFSIYEDIPHLLKQPITTYEETKQTFYNIIDDINARYEILKSNKSRNIKEYNNKSVEHLKYKIIVIDELAELLMIENKSKISKAINGGDRLEDLIVRVAQIGRACGVHLILATQRPSSDVITGLLKANIPSKIALSVSNKINSRVILDENGAENLTGKGDAILSLIGSGELVRFQTPFISDAEQLEHIQQIKNKYINYINNNIGSIDSPLNLYDIFINLFIETLKHPNNKKNINDFIFTLETQDGINYIFNYLKIDNNFNNMIIYKNALKDFKQAYETKEQQEQEKKNILGLHPLAFASAVFIGICEGLGKNKKRR